MAFVFHNGSTSGVLEGPAYCIEDADRSSTGSWRLHDGEPVDHAPCDVELLDPACERLVGTFEQPPITPPGIINTLVLPDEVSFYPVTGGPLVPAVQLAG